MLLVASTSDSILSPVCRILESFNRQVQHSTCLGDGLPLSYQIKLVMLSHTTNGSSW